jgi:CubicO group peptidase (beta-lactamase class C family)
MDDLGPLLSDWPVDVVAAGVTNPADAVAAGGDLGWKTRIASVSKLLVAFAGLVALEEGTLTLDEPAGPEGSTVRHLMAHASGLAFAEDRTLAPPGKRRIYSNIGFEKLAAHLAQRAGIEFDRYVTEAVVEPLGMTDTEVRGSPADGMESTVGDLLRLGRELLAPTLIGRVTLDDATRPHFPALKGVLPGIGSFDPNPWGLGFELRNGKRPHWTGTANSEGTFGHFGGAGTFLWVDPAAGLAVAALTTRAFDEWAMATWPRFSDQVLERYHRAGTGAQR